MSPDISTYNIPLMSAWPLSTQKYLRLALHKIDIDIIDLIH